MDIEQLRVLVTNLDDFIQLSGGTASLRTLVLGMGVSGDLAPQDPTEECGRSVARSLGAVPLESEFHNQMPRSWALVRLDEIAEVRLGRQRSPERAVGDRMRPYLRAGNVTWTGLNLDDVKEMAFTEAESTVYELKEGDLILGEASGSPSEVGKPAQFRGEIAGCCFQNTLIRVRLSAQLLPDYYENVFRYEARCGRFADGSRGLGIQHLGAKTLSAWRVPLPPVEEQTRIVRALREVNDLIDALDAALEAERRQKERLTSVALGRLGDEGDRLAIDQIHEIVRTLDDVKQVEKAISALAVSGRLVPQVQSEGTASDLLVEIRSQPPESAKVARLKGTRARVTKQLGLTKPKQALPRLPPQWGWVALGHIVKNLDSVRVPLSKEERAGRHGPYDYYGASGVIDGVDDFLFDGDLLLVGEDGANLLSRSSPIAFIAKGKYWVNNHAHVLDAMHNDMLEYLALFLNATDLTPYVTGTAQPKMNQAKMNTIPIALPPLEEQRRIVRKVRELFKLTAGLRSVLAA